MSTNKVELTQLESGDFEIDFNNENMDNIVIRDPLRSKFSCGALMAAAALCCASGSMLYELDARKPGARYNSLRTTVTRRIGKDEKGRRVYGALDVNVRAQAVLKEHEDNMCTILRSLDRGMRVDLEISST